MSVNSSLKVTLCMSPECQFHAHFVPLGVSDIPQEVAPLPLQQLLHLPVWRTLPFSQDLESIFMLIWWSKRFTVTFVWESFSGAPIFCSGCMGWRALAALTGVRLSSGHRQTWSPRTPVVMSEEPTGQWTGAATQTSPLHPPSGARGCILGPGTLLTTRVVQPGGRAQRRALCPPFPPSSCCVHA